LNRFYNQYPEYKDKTYLSVKGGLVNMSPDASEENLRKSVTNINSILGGKKMDLFEMARVDKGRSIEDAMTVLVKLQSEGRFKDIGLSEVSADTIRRASKIGKIAAVEVEYSPWSMDIEQNDVLATCKELQIPIVAYSPLGRGFLTGQIRKLEDLPEGDNRRHYDRFQPGNFETNLKLVEKIEGIAKSKGVTPAQLCLAWLMDQSDLIYPIPGSTRVEGVKEALGALSVSLSQEESKEIRQLVESSEVKGGRYNDKVKHTLEG